MGNKTYNSKRIAQIEKTAKAALAAGGGGGGAVTSVFGRTGVVVATTNDYTWAQIDKTTSDLADLATKSHTSLTDIGTNTHAQIDTALAGLITASSNMAWTGTHSFQHATPVEFQNGIDLHTSGVILSDVADGSSAIGFDLQDTISRTQGHSLMLQNTSLTKKIMLATWDGRFSFGYTSSLQAQLGHILAFTQSDAESPTGSPHMVGILAQIGHGDATETIDRLYGIVGASSVQTATGFSADNHAGVVGVAVCNDDTTGNYGSKTAIGVLGRFDQTGSLATMENRTLNGASNSYVPAGDWGVAAAFYGEYVARAGHGTGSTYQPTLITSAYFNIPGWSSTSGSQYGVYIDDPNTGTTLTPAISMAIHAVFPTRGTRKAHVHLVPTAAAASGPTGNASGDLYFDDGTNNREGMYEYDSTNSEWQKLRQTLCKDGSLESPTTSDIRWWFYTPIAITVREAVFVAAGTTPSVAVTIYHHTTYRSGSKNTMVAQTVTNTTTGHVVTSFTDATIPADSHVWIEIGTTSGTNDEVAFHVEFTEDE